MQLDGWNMVAKWMIIRGVYDEVSYVQFGVHLIEKYESIVVNGLLDELLHLAVACIDFTN